MIIVVVVIINVVVLVAVDEVLDVLAAVVAVIVNVVKVVVVHEEHVKISYEILLHDIVCDFIMSYCMIFHVVILYEIIRYYVYHMNYKILYL